MVAAPTEHGGQHFPAGGLRSAKSLPQARNRSNPTDREKLGWKWSVTLDRRGIPIGWSTVHRPAPTATMSALETTLDDIAAHGLADLNAPRRGTKQPGEEVVRCDSRRLGSSRRPTHVVGDYRFSSGLCGSSNATSSVPRGDPSPSPVASALACGADQQGGSPGGLPHPWWLRRLTGPSRLPLRPALTALVGSTARVHVTAARVPGESGPPPGVLRQGAAESTHTSPRSPENAVAAPQHRSPQHSPSRRPRLATVVLIIGELISWRDR